MSIFQNKTIVITGGAGVLCSEMARAFAREAGQVALIGRTEATLKAVSDEIKEAGGKSLAVVADVLDQASLISAKDQIHDSFGPCDILINGAGGNAQSGTADQPFFSAEQLKGSDRSFFDLDPDGISHVFQLNFMGTFLPTQVFARDMFGRQGCSILNVSSVAAAKPLTKVSAYSAAKAAITNFTEWMAVHFAKEGIRVNALVPGFFLTQQNKSLLTEENGSLTDRGQTILSKTPMGRFGCPEDLVGGVLWISGPEAQFVTGIVLTIDGGFNAFNGV